MHPPFVVAAGYNESGFLVEAKAEPGKFQTRKGDSH